MSLDIDYFGDRRMSKEDKLNQFLDLTQLNIEERRELIMKAIKEGKEEAKYILMLTEYDRPGPSFTDRATIKILYGEVERVLMNRVYSYPTTDEYLYALIPKTRTVVLLYKSASDYEGELEKHEKLFVFSYPEGWKSISLY